MKTWEQLGLLLLLAGALLGALAKILMGSRRKPEERERSRRMAVNRYGRLGEATINDIQNDTIFYSYEIGGVSYNAAQDISTLRDRVPIEADRFAGFAKLKYEANNPANSILVCEKWSGIRPVPVRANRASD